LDQCQVTSLSHVALCSLQSLDTGEMDHFPICFLYVEMECVIHFNVWEWIQVGKLLDGRGVMEANSTSSSIHELSVDTSTL
jgi:hypothetical protein